MTSVPTAIPESDHCHAGTPVSLIRSALLVGVALAAGCLTAWLLARHEGRRFIGRLEAQTTFVNAERGGVVTALLVREGDRVSLDDPLVSVCDSELQAQIVRITDEVQLLESQRDQAQAAAAVELAWRIKEIDADIVETQLRSADYLKEKFDWELERSMWADVLSNHETVMFEDGGQAFQSLLLKARLPAEQRMSAILKHETAANAVDVSAVQLEICNARLEQLRNLKDQLPERVRQTAGVDVAERRLAQAQQALARLEERSAELVVASTAIGTVGVFRARPGDRLQPGDPIVEILDDARRWVVVLVPSGSIPEFTPERKLLLTFPGRRQRTGRVVAVAPQTQRAGSEDMLDPLVMVRVEQTGALWPDAPLGSRVDVQLAE